MFIMSNAYYPMKLIDFSMKYDTHHRYHSLTHLKTTASVDNEFLGVTICSTTLSVMCYLYSIKHKLRSVNSSDWSIHLICFVYDFTKDYLARFPAVTMLIAKNKPTKQNVVFICEYM